KTVNQHSSVINLNTATNNNDNGCSTQQLWFKTGERTRNGHISSKNLEQKINEVIKQQQENKAITQSLRSLAKILKNSRVQSLAIRSDNSTAVFDIKKWRASTSLKKEIKQVHQTIEKLGIQIQIIHLSRVKKRNSRSNMQTIKSRRLQAKGEDFSTDMSSDELEPNNRLILTTLKQPTAKIHVNNKRTRRNSNRRSQSNMEDGTSMDSSSYPSPSSYSEKDQKRSDRNSDNSSTMTRSDMVYKTGKRECTVPYALLEQRNFGTRNIVNQEKFETPSRKDMLFPDGPKAKKGRRFARKILRMLNVSQGVIDMILYGQRYNIQRRYYYAMEKLKKWTQINHYSIPNLLTMKQHIIITEMLAQFTSVNTSASSALQFLNGISSMLSLTFDIDLKNNRMLQFTRKAISALDRQTEIRRHMERGNTI
ncbi:MAG: hypothetical protein EZS28_008960, partial [Streblomastix strix]